MAETAEIPEPRGLPLLGHVRNIDSEFPLGSMMSYASQFGEIYRLRFPGRTIVVVSTQALVNETCNEKRFHKTINSALNEVRNGVHDGLFTAFDGEKNWGIAHRVLMPAFGPLSIRGMFDEMHDIASQLALKWARSDKPIMVTDDFTRLTLDTLALCSMGYRFNSYYDNQMHPFIEAMGDFLTESGARPMRPPLSGLFYRSQDEKYNADIDILRKTAKGVLESRQSGASDRRDLLTAMLEGVDKQTGEKMTDESIMDNLITFLIAGHETTSGLLSFAFYQLCKNPETYQAAQKEVDEVCGKGPITVDQLSKLPYINGVLRETLRVNATIPIIGVTAREDTLLAGKYPVKKGETILNLLSKSQVDPAVFGDDATEFKPERMMDANFEKLNNEYPNFWKPFGNGMRACIGRPFAWQEALLVMAMLLQNFNFVLESGYNLHMKQTLTIKPKDMYMRAILRDGLTPTSLQHRLTGSAPPEKAASNAASKGADDPSSGQPMTILYGSNSGTCEALAQRVASDAAAHGFRATTVDCLDSAKGQLPKDQPVVIVTASYEGQPPDNASHFVTWIEGLGADALEGVSYSVFGCGHKDWVQTYHRVPKTVDIQMEKVGATRVAALGLGDASSGDLFTDFESWEDEVLWPSLAEKFKVSEVQQAKGGVDVSIKTPRASTLRQDVKEGVVTKSYSLCASGNKRHIEIKLPEGVTYSAGDYLAVLPINPRDSIHRAMRRLGIARDAHLEITTESGGSTALPMNTSVPAYDVFGSYVELSQPATKRNIATLAEYATDETHKQELDRLATAAFDEEIKALRMSVLDVLDKYSSVELPAGAFLNMMPPMRVRQYSISSSPLWQPDHATVTFSLLEAPALSGQGSYVGVATSYLASLLEKDTVLVAVRPSHAAFSMPVSPETTPAIYVCAGSGMAPFRGFIQERAAMMASNKQRAIAPAMLFYGCRSPDEDDIYHEELNDWSSLGAVEVYRSYSRAPEQSEDCKHVNDMMWKQRARMLELWSQGAKIYVCGSRGVAESAKEAILKIKSETEGGEASEDKNRDWLEGLRNVRYVTDVFE